MTERYESRASTHADDCWSWGPGHYKCAVRKIERLRTENARLREDAARYRLLRKADGMGKIARAALHGGSPCTSFTASNRGDGHERK